MSRSDDNFKKQPQWQKVELAAGATVRRSSQPYDKYEYARWKASRELKLPEYDLPDEPDFNTNFDIDRE
jgi:hypothetical protein